MRDEFGLTPKQRIWADAYLETGNYYEADRRAGYKHSMQSQNSRIPQLKAYIEARMQTAAEGRIATADEVLRFLTDVMAGRVKDQFGLDASLQDRLKAGQELLKRYAVADDRQRGTMARLDSMFAEFRLAVSAPAATSTQDGQRQQEQARQEETAPAEQEGTP